MKSALLPQTTTAPPRVRRSSATSLVLGLSIAMISLVASAWAFERQVLDPNRSDRIAALALDAPEVRQRLEDETATGLVHLAQPDQLTDTDALAAAVTAMLESPELSARLNQRFESAHQLGLSGEQQESFLDDRELRTEARTIMNDNMPGVALKRPTERRFDMQLPIEGYTILSHLQGPIGWLTSVGLAIAVIGLFGSLGLSGDRAETCRGAASWALGSAAAWLLVASLFEMGAKAAMPVPFRAVGHTLTLGLNATAGPATAIAATGLALLAFGALWPAFNRRRGAAYLARPASVGH